VDQILEQLRKNRLGRPLLAGDREDGIGAAGPQGCQQPSHDQDKVVSAGQIEKRCEILDGAACFRCWQRQHARRSAEAHWWRADDPPSVGSDLDGAPALIGEVEIDVAGVLGEANMHYPLEAIKLSLRLKEIER